MNKQQALEAFLVLCRTYEQPHEEVACLRHEEALAKAVEAARNLDVLVASAPSARRTAGIRETLKLLGGLALYALVDEVEVVEASPAAYAPVVVNGIIPGTLHINEPQAVNGLVGGYPFAKAALPSHRHRASCHGPIGELQCGGDDA